MKIYIALRIDQEAPTNPIEGVFTSLGSAKAAVSEAFQPDESSEPLKWTDDGMVANSFNDEDEEVAWRIFEYELAQ